LEEFGDKLKTTWKVTDNDGKNHNLQLNEDLSLPLLTNGFITLRDQYQLQNMQQIFFITWVKAVSSFNLEKYMTTLTTCHLITVEAPRKEKQFILTSL
jgi:hypothetical protein